MTGGRPQSETSTSTRSRLENLSRRVRLTPGIKTPRTESARREVAYHRPGRQKETVVDDTYRRQHAHHYRCLERHTKPIIYRDRPVSYRPSHTYDYCDRYQRRCHRIIWPHYRCRIYYPSRSHAIVAHHYPYYHRKYVFVSLGGWWPTHYNCLRYHWYGWHPYNWYGYAPVPREVGGSTYNEYTYNYYGTASPGAIYDTSRSSSYSSTSAMPGALPPADHTTFSDVRARSTGEEGVPAAVPADQFFAKGVSAFEEGAYTMAATYFQQAMAQAPDDAILPFAYAQALFAAEQYLDALNVLRLALEKTPAPGEQVGVFYPRGLYQDDDTLYTHIDRFMDVQEQKPGDSGLRLLLGYHLLGIGEVTLAREILEPVKTAPTNRNAAVVLLDLADRLEQEAPTDAQIPSH